MKPCLFCSQEDSGLKNKCTPGRDVDFVCSRCVTILLGTEQSELKRGVEIAAEKNLVGKVESLKMFIEPEEVVNVRPNQKRLKRNYDRTGGNRPDRFKQRCFG
jgi:hypothetical protein